VDAFAEIFLSMKEKTGQARICYPLTLKIGIIIFKEGNERRRPYGEK
jgi:hypothetical protein